MFLLKNFKKVFLRKSKSLFILNIRNILIISLANAMKRALSEIHLLATQKCGYFSKRFLTLRPRTHVLSKSNMRIIIHGLWSR